MSRAFENDPRLKHMDPGRLSALQSLAKKQKPFGSWQDGCRKPGPVHNKKGVPQKQAV